MMLTKPAESSSVAGKHRKTVDEVMAQLDDWVSRHGSKKYEADAFLPMEAFMIPEDAAIQQNRDEIKEFAALLLARPQRSSVLEIGLGAYGSTHFLWRLLFDHVMTIEKSHERLRTFGANLRNFHNQWVLNDRRSSFLIGSSQDPETVRKAYQCAVGGVDVLFIDGDHRYTSVLMDWLLYSPLVKPGGLVAFHDVSVTVNGYYGIPEFLDKLSRGQIDSQPRALATIIHTKNMGIAYYEK